MLQNVLRLCLVIGSWSSMLLFPKRAFKLFLPVTIFITALVSILLVLSKPYKLWYVPGRNSTKLFNDICFMLGPFFVANLWVFKLAFGNIWQYLGINLVLDFLMAFPVSKLFKKLNIYKLQRLKPLYFFIVIYSFAILGYGFQYYLREPGRN